MTCHPFSAVPIGELYDGKINSVVIVIAHRVAPRMVKDVSCVSRNNHESHFASQV